MPPKPEPRISEELLTRLRSKLRLLDAVIEGTTDAVFAKDLEGRYQMINAAGAAFCGRQIDEIIGKTDAEIFPPAVARNLTELDRNIVLGGVPVTLEEDMVIDESQTIWLSMKAPYRDENGEIVGVIGISRDITQLRVAQESRHNLELESQALRAQKLESLGVLAGGIAHDFNNLLVGILGNADLALDELDPTSELRELVEDIIISAKGAADLCREMLAYSGKGHFVVQPTDVNALALEMRPLLGVSAPKDVTIEYDLDPDLPAVLADTAQLRQVIMNLVTNASDAVEGQGFVKLRTHLVRRDHTRLAGNLLDSELAEGDYVSFEVSDTGNGMDAETIGKIFDPFFTTKIAGRGLGLAAVMGIIRGHSGGLRVDSEIGRGTTFEVLLPSCAAPALPDSETSPTKGWSGSGTVLLVDDDPSVCRVGTRMLRSLGFKTVTASSGAEALRIFAERSADLACVILDLTMPGLSGEETFARLQELDEHVTVILSSGFTEQEFHTLYGRSGLAGFVQKPYELSTLRQTLSKIL